MKPERYEETKHRPMVDAWCAGWEMSTFPPHWLPEFGWIVPDVLAMWLYRTDSAVYFLENVISSPDASDTDKSAALDAIQAEVEAVVMARGGGYVVGQSSLPEIWKHAKRNGYNVEARPMRQIVKRVLPPIPLEAP